MIPIKVLKEKIDGPRLKDLLPVRLIENEEAQNAVTEIVKKVRAEGDAALLGFTAKFDGAELSAAELRVKPVEFERARQEAGPEFVEAIVFAKERIRAYHGRRETESRTTLDKDTGLGQLVLPIERAGIYVPGGRAAYPSSVLMNAVPAQVAGVSEIAMCVPPDREGKVNPFTLTAAAEAGLDEVYKAGGAQAIAAMAYGTETIKKVDKITGPGNIYVTLAKKMVLGTVGIDMLAGPSEVVIVADSTARADFIAADMLAQAEHDPQAMAVLISTSEKLAGEVIQALAEQLEALRQPGSARSSLENNGRIFIVSSVGDAVELVNHIAPEHLELMVEDPRSLLGQVKNAGAVFLGAYSPEVAGDYLAGPNHILPTCGTARFCSPLSVDDFMKKTSLIDLSKEGLFRLIPSIEIIAEAEKLEAHARAALIRKEVDA